MHPVKIRKITVKNSQKLCSKQVKAVSDILYDKGIHYKVTIGKIYITFTTQPLTDTDFWPLQKKIKDAKKSVK